MALLTDPKIVNALKKGLCITRDTNTYLWQVGYSEEFNTYYTQDRQEPYHSWGSRKELYVLDPDDLASDRWEIVYS